MDLRVDTDELARFSAALERSLSSLAEARQALEHVRADQLGTAELDEACDGFQERWRYGADLLRERIGSIHDGVKLSHREYARVNAAVAAAFRAVNPDG
ncbi:hypothetical protein [Streptomyces sp. CAU 1734]|uniref:hypothetical protein n=1 Tax=Streptomyces sp. CAU 1734 TaxID=3140360 RepID=UPI0032614F72